MTCSICLEPLKLPVSVPCGHIHCEQCLAQYIRQGADVVRSSCPTCRAPFNIMTPDLAYVPEKLHEFMLPAVRRVYVDPTPVQKLRDAERRLKRTECKLKDTQTQLKEAQHKLEGAEHRLEDAETRIHVLQHEKMLLTKEAAACAQLKDAHDAAQRGRAKLAGMCDVISDEHDETKRRYVELDAMYAELDARYDELSARYAALAKDPASLKRKAHSESDDGENEDNGPQTTLDVSAMPVQSTSGPHSMINAFLRAVQGHTSQPAPPTQGTAPSSTQSTAHYPMVGAFLRATFGAPPGPSTQATQGSVPPCTQSAVPSPTRSDAPSSTQTAAPSPTPSAAHHPMAGAFLWATFGATPQPAPAASTERTQDASTQGTSPQPTTTTATQPKPKPKDRFTTSRKRMRLS
ncbi:hypothetical protein PLICRDRAFT_178261 [Plicaturopsis crispa FD-325 SS-3]|nr:hypothetical protein PLICRDRAFT_178261 [Plicaturopsis crispa FD-325 SS-3]